jgi:zinc finger CCCH domain-containing protein 13
METYVPASSGGGILGGKTAEGEVDGLQAWKQGMKAKEQKEKEKAETKDKSVAPATPEAKSEVASSTVKSDSSLDEIQLFKLMMKKEEGKKNTENHSEFAASIDDNAKVESSSKSIDDQVYSYILRVTIVPVPSAPPGIPIPQALQATTESKSSLASDMSRSASGSVSESSPGVLSDGPRSLLSLLTSSSASTGPSAHSENPPAAPAMSDRTASRLFSKPLHPEAAPPTPPTFDTPQTTFTPPPGSRLLALGTRGGAPNNQPLGSPGLEMPGGPAIPQASDPRIAGVANANAHVAVDHLERLNRDGFPPRSISSEMQGVLDGPSRSTFPPTYVDPSHFGNRTGGASPGPYSEVGGGRITPSNAFPPAGVEASLNGTGLGGSKGSRFAKFFDKGRDIPPAELLRAQGLSPTPPLGGPRQDVGDARAMDQIFAMLNNSTQESTHTSIAQK